MSNWYQEIGDSPKEVFTSDLFTAERIFLLDWSRRGAFVTLFLGRGYPGHSDATVRKITVQPLENDSRIQAQNLLTGLGTIAHGKAVLYYSNASTGDEDEE